MNDLMVAHYKVFLIFVQSETQDGHHSRTQFKMISCEKMIESFFSEQLKQKTGNLTEKVLECMCVENFVPIRNRRWLMFFFFFMLIGILIIANTAGKCSKETMEKSSNIPSETTNLTESTLCIHIYMIVSYQHPDSNRVHSLKRHPLTSLSQKFKGILKRASF